VQWDTSTHDWLEGRGETMYLISMIDDATSRLFTIRAPRQQPGEHALVVGLPEAVRPAAGILYG